MGFAPKNLQPEKFSALGEGGALSIRTLAQATGIPKSSVARHRQALEERNRWPEAPFWEQEEGYQWLRLLVFAVIFVFGIKGGMGAERLSEFFHRVRLDRHVGSSPTALRGLQGQLEDTIVAYQTAHATELRQAGRRVEICAGAEQALASMGLKLRYVVSDRAQALVKLALDGLACPSIPDVFHALRDLAKVVGVSFHLKLARLEEKRIQAQQRLNVLQAKGQEARIQQRFLAQLNEQVATLQIDQANAPALRRDASYAGHPFTLQDSTRQNAVQVEAALHQVLAALNTLHQRHTARDNAKAVAKFARQIPGLATLVDGWWRWVEQSLSPDTVATDLGCIPKKWKHSEAGSGIIIIRS